MAQVSVIVPVYNVQAYLPRCMESIAAQTFSDFECILVDDGSLDKCGELCDEWSARDPRFKVVHKQNGGLASARNAGLEIACGKWIVFCDSDDLLHPQTLELALEAQANSGPNTLVCWKYGPFTAAPPLLTNRAEPRSPEQLFADGDFASVCSKLWERQLLSLLSLRFDETMRWAEDLDFTSRYLLAFLARTPEIKIVVIPHVLYFYEAQRPGNLTTSYFAAKLSCEFGLLPQLLQLFQLFCGDRLDRWAPFCQQELFVLLGRLSECARFEKELTRAERHLKIRQHFISPPMRRLLALSHNCHVWPAMGFCARHGLIRLCLFLQRNCYKPWYTQTVRTWFWIRDKFYWGGQALKSLLPTKKE